MFSSVRVMSESNVFFKRLVVEKGITTKVGEDYVKATYTLEVDLSALEQTDKTVEDSKKLVENLIDKWIEEEKGVASTMKEVAKVPEIDVGVIDNLPWKNFQKEPCKPFEAGWIMRNHEAAQKLATAIEKAEGSLVIGNMEYVFSGDKKQFINRKPVKKEK